MTYTTRFYLLAATIGVLVGVIVSAFQISIAHTLGWYSAIADGAATRVGIPPWLASACLGAGMLLVGVALLRRLAPEAAGGGIHEVEAHLEGLRPMRWRQVLPVKFFGGVLALGSHLAVGPEGPAVHMGGAVGRMLGDRFRLGGEHGKALVCAGAAAGLAAVFNAPLAGFLFVMEQMRRHFPLSIVSFHGLMLACWTSAVVTALFYGQGPAFPIRSYSSPALLDLLLFIALGTGIGAFACVFNGVLLRTIDVLAVIRRRLPYVVAPSIGALTGILFWMLPDSVSSGQQLTLVLFQQPYSWQMLLVLLTLRLLTTVISYAAETPGGIFAPMLAIGALFGFACGKAFGVILPDLVAEPGVYALAAMGALFAASFRIPLTAIVLVLEITRSASVVLAIVASCISASLAAQALGARPLYDVLLARLRSEAEARGTSQREPTTTSPIRAS